MEHIVEINVSVGDLFNQSGDTLVIYAPKGRRQLSGDTAAADKS